MKERARNLMVGIMSIAGLVGLGVILLLFGYVPSLLEPGYFITIELNQAAGLSQGSVVRYKGVNIGQIKEVALHQDKVELRAKITYKLDDQVIGVPLDVRVRVESPMIGGAAHLALDDAHLNKEERRVHLPRDDSARLSAQVQPAGGGFAGQFREMLREPLLKFEALSDEWTLVASNLNLLIEPRSPEEVDGGAQGNLPSMLARADARLAEMRDVLQGINVWVNDETLRGDVTATIANFKATSENVKEGTADLRALLDDAGMQIDRLTRRYVAVADDMSQTIRSVQAMIDNAREGDGTLGKLLNDPAVYDNLNDAIQRVNAAIKEAQLLLEKWKKEGVPVRL